jgi:(p)ppGpp synthase/HD superfamily hydrolase
MNDLESLKNLVLAPYILKATALIGVSRRVGGNQFRHAFATLGILLDYKHFNDPVLLKAALLHDLLEDLPETQVDEIRWIDQDGQQVVELVLEVTRRKDETKQQYLQRVLNDGSKKALLLKCADRISNLTDLHRDTHSDQKISEYLDQTEQYIIPMAEKVNADLVIELTDLVNKRRRMASLEKEFRKSHRFKTRFPALINRWIQRFCIVT